MSTPFASAGADAYENLMGRWSRSLTAPFIEFFGLSGGERILDVGCGTGSLTHAIAKSDEIQAVTGIDPSEYEKDNRPFSCNRVSVGAARTYVINSDHSLGA